MGERRTFKFKLSVVYHREFLKKPQKGERTPVGIRYALVSATTGDVVAHLSSEPHNASQVPFIARGVVPMKLRERPVLGGYEITAGSTDEVVNMLKDRGFHMGQKHCRVINDMVDKNGHVDPDKHCKIHERYATGRLKGLSTDQRNQRNEFFSKAISRHTYVPAVTEKDFRVIVFTKKHGRERVVYAPSERIKAALEKPLDALNKLQEKIVSRAVCGFVPGRNIAYAAWKHVGRKFTLSADLSDFFDHVTQPMCVHAVKSFADESDFNAFTNLTNEYSVTVPDSRLHEFMFPDGKARQGLPTSPALANIAAIPLDKKIQREWPTVVYTRYADDLAFSCDDKELLDDIRTRLPEMIESIGLKANPRKWRLQSSRGGRRIITGISVGEDDIRVPRRYRKALRPVVHQNRRPSRTRGMLAWQNYVNDYTPLDEFQDLEL